MKITIRRRISATTVKSCAAINKEKPSEINRFQRVLVRVARLERAASTSQMSRATNCTTPGYLLITIIARKSCDSKFFPVCGQSCGQSRFLARFSGQAKSRKRPCCKGFRALAVSIVDEIHNAPKPPALSTALVPDRVTQILSQFFKNCNAFFPIDVWRALWYYFYLVK